MNLDIFRDVLNFLSLDEFYAYMNSLCYEDNKIVIVAGKQSLPITKTLLTMSLGTE